MNDTYTELQRRLTVAEERNRANIERRNELIQKMKTEFDCETVSELEALLDKTRKELAETESILEHTEQEAKTAVETVEKALGIAIQSLQRQ